MSVSRSIADLPIIIRYSSDRIPSLFFDPKFSSWGKTELCQVLDVEPVTLSGKFSNC